MSVTSKLVNYVFKKDDDKRDAGLTTPDDVIRYDDIYYGENKYQILDVYRPKAVDGKLPVIVSVHGGGWVYGDKERYQYYCMSLVKHGFAVVNFTYRLAPEYKFPAQLEDTVMVFNWLLDHQNEYGFDIDNVFAVGDSAGGHLLGLYSCLCTNLDYADKYHFKVKDNFKPKAVALNCGVYQMDMSNKNDILTRLLRDLLKDKGSDEEIYLINVLNHINNSFPPAYVMTAVEDFVKEHSILLVDKLKQHNIRHIFKIYGDDNNKLGHVFHCNIRTDDAYNCNKEECDFFRSFI